MKNIIIYAICTFILVGCKKQDEWLEKKSNKSDIIPSTVEDFQALLDNTDVMNTKYPAIGLIGADNSYILDQTAISGGTLQERNAYKWSSDIYEGELFAPDWTYPYQVIEYSNVVLEGIEKIKNINDTRIPEVKGTALFFRAFAYYQLAQLYAKQYNESTADSDLGLPLKLNSDVNDLPNRSTLKETYYRIINDLIEAESLLPLQVSYKTRPTKLAAESMLSKVYFNMQNYTKAKEFADIVLSKNSELIDFNTLSTTVNFPFPTVRGNNTEIIFYAQTISYTFNSRQELCVMKDLFDTYENEDLRKAIFFKKNTNGAINFGGRYTGAGALFCGIATNEIFLIRSESLARSGNFVEAMNDLNKLLKERWKKENGRSTYSNKTASNPTEALLLIINERRKELPFTANLRWEDLRRLNMDDKFAKKLTRNVGVNIYTLEANSPRYVFPIPPVEINFHPLTQNIR